MHRWPLNCWNCSYIRQQEFMLWRNMIQLLESFFLIGIFGLYMMEKVVHNQSFFWLILIFLMWRQNNWCCSTKNTSCIHKLPLHKENIGVWCAVSVSKITGPISYGDTVNGVRYVNKTQSSYSAGYTVFSRKILKQLIQVWKHYGRFPVTA